MATRFHYAAPILRQLLISRARRLRSGGLPASLPTSSQDKPFVIVTGSGRSGTSAVARVLHESGVKMGENFGEPSEMNPVGFYQELPVGDLNGRLMMECGLSRPNRWAWRSTVLAVAEEHREEMEDLASTATDGWKDPLFSLTLEAWLPHLPRRLKVVLCVRSPEAYERSATRMYGLLTREAIEEIERWWVNNLRRILDIIRDYRLEATCVAYDDLVQRPEETVAAVASFIGRPLDAKYVEPELRHYEYPVPRRHAALYQRALALDLRRPAAARQASGVAALLARLGKRDVLTEDEARAIDEYLERVRAIAFQVVAAKADWGARVGAPEPKLARYEELGSNQRQVLEETRSASAEYVQVLSKVQPELGMLLPPAALERYHETTRDWVDRERLAAQLVLQAAAGPHPDRGALADALRAWRLFSSPEAEAKMQKRRRRAYQRGLRASGYRAAQAEMERS